MRRMRASLACVLTPLAWRGEDAWTRQRRWGGRVGRPEKLLLCTTRLRDISLNYTTYLAGFPGLSAFHFSRAYFNNATRSWFQYCSCTPRIVSVRK